MKTIVVGKSGASNEFLNYIRMKSRSSHPVALVPHVCVLLGRCTCKSSHIEHSLCLGGCMDRNGLVFPEE